MTANYQWYIGITEDVRNELRACCESTSPQEFASVAGIGTHVIHGILDARIYELPNRAHGNLVRAIAFFNNNKKVKA